MNALFPLVSFVPCSLDQANELLVRWQHKMGPVRRPNNFCYCHVLIHETEPVAVTTTHTLIRETAGGIPWLTRDDTVELSRLCAARPGLSRVALRLWREFVFPALKTPYAVSYQDADIHTGNTYRFDGWQRIAYSHSGGSDQRSGRPGRNKYIWIYPPNKNQEAI